MNFHRSCTTPGLRTSSSILADRKTLHPTLSRGPVCALEAPKVSVTKTVAKALNEGNFVQAFELCEGAEPDAMVEYDTGHCTLLALAVKKAAEAGVKGIHCADYRQSRKIVEGLLSRAFVKCKCTGFHRCPLGFAVGVLKINSEAEVLSDKGDLLRMLLLKGATLNITKGTQNWIDWDGLRCYLITKNYKFLETRN